MRTSRRQQWTMLVASIIDLIICLTCLMLFLGAEIERCCDGNEYPPSASSYAYDNYDDQYSDSYGEDKEHNHTYSEHQDEGGYHEPANEGEYRFLAGASDYESEPEVCYDTTPYCNCPKYGTRVEGGLGPIEPWAALVVFRIFRFILAKQIVQRFDIVSVFDEVKNDESDQHEGKNI